MNDLTNIVKPLLISNDKLSTNALTISDADERINELNHYQDQVDGVLSQHLSKDELSNFKTLKSNYANNFIEANHNMLTNQPAKNSTLMQGVQNGLMTQQPTTNFRMSAGDGITDMANDGNLSFFALLITVMLFGYNTTAEYGKLMLLKQKDAQAAASSITELQKMLLELKNLVGDDSIVDSNGKKITNMYDLFAIANGSGPTDANTKAKVKGVLDKYKDVLSSVKDPSTGNPYMDGMTWNGNDKPKFLLMMNGYIDSVNKQITDNGVSSSMKIQTFASLDAITYDTDDKKKNLTTYFDTNGKNCESVSSQLTTINQNIQASVSQATETVKSLLEWLKQSITGYGTAINPRG